MIREKLHGTELHVHTSWGTTHHSALSQRSQNNPPTQESSTTFCAWCVEIKLWADPPVCCLAICPQMNTLAFYYATQWPNHRNNTKQRSDVLPNYHVVAIVQPIFQGLQHIQYPCIMGSPQKGNSSTKLCMSLYHGLGPPQGENSTELCNFWITDLDACTKYTHGLYLLATSYCAL